MINCFECKKADTCKLPNKNNQLFNPCPSYIDKLSVYNKGTRKILSEVTSDNNKYFWEKSSKRNVLYSNDLEIGQSCGHPGCLSHISHPCENCGRINGRPTLYQRVKELREKMPKTKPGKETCFDCTKFFICFNESSDILSEDLDITPNDDDITECMNLPACTQFKSSLKLSK